MTFSSSKRNVDNGTVRQKVDRWENFFRTGGMEGNVKGADGTLQLLEKAVEELCDKATRKLQYQYRILGKSESVFKGNHVHHNFFYVVDVVVQKNEEREDTVDINVVRIEDEISSNLDASAWGSWALDDITHSQMTIYPGSKDFARLVPQECVELECQRRVKKDDCKHLTDMYDIVRCKLCPYITSCQMKSSK